MMPPNLAELPRVIAGMRQQLQATGEAAGGAAQQLLKPMEGAFRLAEQVAVEAQGLWQVAESLSAELETERRRSVELAARVAALEALLEPRRGLH